MNEENLFEETTIEVTHTSNFKQSNNYHQSNKTSKNKILQLNALIILIYLLYMFASALVSRGLDNMRADETKDWLDGDIDYVISPTDNGYDFTIFGNLENVTDTQIDLVYLRFDLNDENGDLLEDVYHKVRFLEPGEIAPLDKTYSVDHFPSEVLIYSQIPDNPTLANVLSVIVSVIAFVALWLVNKDNYIDKFNETKKSFKNFAGTIAVGFVLVFAANIMAQSIMQLFETTETSLNESAIQSMFNDNPLNLFALFLSLVLLAPIIEETVFRKGLYGIIEHRFGAIPAIIISGFVFGFLHVAGWGDYINVLPYLAMGLSFSFIYYYSGKNIYVVIVIHMINNIIPFSTYLIDSIS